MSNDKPILLVVDDIASNITILDAILREDYQIRAAINGSIALELAQADTPPDLILLDVMMPEIDGFEVCRQLKARSSTSHIPVIFVTAKDEVGDETHGFELGAVDYIHKPISPSVVKARVRTQLALYDQNRELEKRVRERTAELNKTRLQIIRQLGRAGEFRDNETGMHVIRVSHYCRLLAQAVGMNDKDVDIIFNASPMHDIGKIGIRDSILLKPGKLDDEEFAIMKTHTAIGAEILDMPTSDLKDSEVAVEHYPDLHDMAREIALTHHEKWNGQGYPNGLKGEQIPLVGRICAIADVFDALTSERPYKKAWSVEEAVELIQRESGHHFDPQLVDCFMKILPQILQCREAYADPLS